MPGHCKDKIVGVAREQLDELTCSLCLGVLNDPVMTYCCQQSFCSDCINESLKHRNICPNDRQDLEKEDLLPVSRALRNIIQDLQIKCCFESEGCRTIVKIAHYDKHVKKCDFKPNSECKVCGLVMESAAKHNCINSLKHELAMVMDEKRDIELAREHLDTFTVVRRIATNDELFDYLVYNCKTLIRLKDNFDDIANCLFDKLVFHADYCRSDWNVVIGNRHKMSWFTRHKSYVYFRFHDLLVVITSFN